MLFFRLLLGALALASVQPSLALAQGTRPAAKGAPAPAAAPSNEATIQARVEALTTNMTQGLGLTPAQAEKVRAINLSSVRNVEAARLRYRQDPAKLRGYIDEIGLARLEQLKDVLSATQFQRYQQKREEKMGIPKAGGVQGTPPPGLGSREDN